MVAVAVEDDSDFGVQMQLYRQCLKYQQFLPQQFLQLVADYYYFVYPLYLVAILAAAAAAVDCNHCLRVVADVKLTHFAYTTAAAAAAAEAIACLEA